MTAYTWGSQLIQTTDAEFRAWGSGISAALAAIGLVQTADTGQINWTTVLKPGAGSTAQGYEIWRMNDAAQSTCPIYFKIEYGSGNSATNPTFWFTVATGSNGSGTLTGTTILARQQMTNSLSADGSARASFASGGAGYFWLSTAPAGTTIGASFGFSRFCDASGTISTDGGLWWWQTSMHAAAISGVSYHRPLLVVRTGVRLCPMPNVITSGVYGADVAIFEPVIWGDRPTRVFGVLGCYVADFTAGSSFSATAWGGTKTLLPLTGSVGVKNVDYANSVNTGLVGLYQ